MIEDLKPVALEIGLSAFDFWNMTFGEILDQLSSHNSKREKELKERAFMDYKLSECIGIQVACVLSDRNKPKTFIDVYEFLYSEEEIKEHKESMQLEKEKQHMIDMINYYNNSRK